jgi:putative DNA primase/helicase
MSFESFAAEHGLVINSLVTDKWTRVPTMDHPHKKNGSYIYQGDIGAVQNWAVHDKPIFWKSNTRVTIDYESIRRRKEQQDRETKRGQEEAARKTAWIMHHTKKATHPYLENKGFPHQKAWVWNNLLVIPMRLENNLVGCQMITESGEKRFLSKQRTKGVTAVFDNKGTEILCEGYATAMSIRRALKAHRTRYKIIVCFSAGNILEVAKNHPEAVLVADTDPKGLSVAAESGLLFWKSDVEGEDFNDTEMRIGSHRAGESLLSQIGSRILGVD